MYEMVFKVSPVYRFYKNGFKTDFCCFGLDKCSFNVVARFYGVPIDSITSRLEDAYLRFHKFIKI